MITCTNHTKLVYSEAFNHNQGNQEEWDTISVLPCALYEDQAHTVGLACLPVDPSLIQSLIFAYIIMKCTYFTHYMKHTCKLLLLQYTAPRQAVSIIPVAIAIPCNRHSCTRVLWPIK